MTLKEHRKIIYDYLDGQGLKMTPERHKDLKSMLILMVHDQTKNLQEELGNSNLQLQRADGAILVLTKKLTKYEKGY